ncbi:YeiH family putative sulfate export transporter [Edwardsiella piscicida]|uniref:YeiH family putative sulfate export transporter n=1 Tax=Edwardsiella piscicida TaxID=1263550 RepID=UPI0002C0B6BE|nr:YeiH family protein [Edwardsiella piscicida]AGH73248.1 Putative membrane protein YeiH [Edwardsiella piscicida C07-087]EKS7778934.1 YeiH family putative sulfate export transporter [Edwardsiella piscicida]EKS7782354.1 YeiH family putative sulfate export transporter [Edwardsiella piscicida]EKS7791947.1 YeiH family putative sulfate export transporter [Edwardsiella piscicida]EKS7812061.1 YeiH family putative sulfate export transporter [Edwardsiella piscicida]
MTENRSHASHQTHALLRLLPGLLLTGIITAVSMWAGALTWVEQLGFGALTLAIILGILIGNSVYPALSIPCSVGVHLAKQKFLRLGIILYGFRLTFQQIADVGLTGIVTDALTLSSTFLLALWLGRKVFGMDKQTVMLIGAGSSICGAAAVMATEPVVKADASKVSVAVSTVVIFGTIAIFLYPWLYQLNAHYQWVAMTQESFGIYIGSTVHEVAQVVAAGRAISDDTGNAAVIAKMIRVMMLAPFLLILSSALSRGAGNASGKKAPITIPWFAVIFILVAGVNSFNLLPGALVHALITLDTILLAMAMAALGLTTHISAIRQAGIRPIILASLLFAWLIIGGGAINVVIQRCL